MRLTRILAGLLLVTVWSGSIAAVVCNEGNRGAKCVKDGLPGTCGPGRCCKLDYAERRADEPPSEVCLACEMCVPVSTEATVKPSSYKVNFPHLKKQSPNSEDLSANVRPRSKTKFEAIDVIAWLSVAVFLLSLFTHPSHYTRGL